MERRILSTVGTSALLVIARAFRAMEDTRSGVSYCILAGFIAALTGCASHPPRHPDYPVQALALKQQLLSLGPRVSEREASALAETAVQHSSALAAEYRAIRPAWLHNYFVNTGRRERGLCFEWTNDLFARLQPMRFRTLKLHLAVARMDTRHEHNSIIVTAQRQPFEQGIVLDAWRHSGRLWFGPAAGDRYPWQPLPEDRVDPELARLLAK